KQALNTFDALSKQMLDGKPPLTLEQKLSMSGSKQEEFTALKNAPPDEFKQITALNPNSASNPEGLNTLMSGLNDNEVQLFIVCAQDMAGGSKLNSADTIRAFVLGYADESAVQDVLSGQKLTPQQIDSIKADYHGRFGGDLVADVLNKVDD